MQLRRGKPATCAALPHRRRSTLQESRAAARRGSRARSSSPASTTASRARLLSPASTSTATAPAWPWRRGLSRVPGCARLLARPRAAAAAARPRLSARLRAHSGRGSRSARAYRPSPVSSSAALSLVSFAIAAAEEVGVPAFVLWGTSVCGFVDEIYMTNGNLDTPIDCVAR